MRKLYLTRRLIFKTASAFLLGVLFFTPVYAQSISVRGVVGDFWADKILGQSDFSQDDQNEVTSKTLFHDESVVVDNLHNILYDWDSGNNRIL